MNKTALDANKILLTLATVISHEHVSEIGNGEFAITMKNKQIGIIRYTRTTYDYLIKNNINPDIFKDSFSKLIHSANEKKILLHVDDRAANQFLTNVKKVHMGQEVNPVLLAFDIRNITTAKVDYKKKIIAEIKN